MAKARKMEITIIDANDGYALEAFESTVVNNDLILLVNDKTIKEYDFEFDEEAEYNKINYDYTEALLAIYKDSAFYGR